MNSLPIYSVIDELKQKLKTAEQLVLEAAPGAGKTTVVPLELLHESWLEHQLIVMLEPRRVAARAAAERMAESLGEACGQTVGYRIRQQSRSSKQTRILVVTEGILTRWLQQDPSLEGVGLLIFDEFHERSLESDLGLALSLQSQSLFRDEGPALKILLMSATLDAERLSAFLGGAATVRSEGRQYPVELHYHKRSLERGPGFARSVAQHCHQILQHQRGNMLVFLPGQAEIRQTQQQLQKLLDENPVHSEPELLPLHGSLSLSEQRRAILPLANNKQKVVLATDIAETSLTIDGISLVVDCGLHRCPQFDARTGMSRLHTRRISKASAAQRAGRAGRLGPGQCLRLWPEAEQDSLAEFSEAEIRQADLANFALQLLAWGVTKPSELQLLEQPRDGAYQQALSLLKQLGALTFATASTASSASNSEARSIKLSKRGQQMAKLPCHPRFAHMLLSASKHHCLERAALIAALLSETGKAPISSTDLHEQLRLASRPGTDHKQKKWAQSINKQQQRFIKLCKDIQQSNKQAATASEDSDAWLLALAFPDRIAKQLNRAQALYKLSNGRRARLKSDNKLANSEWLVIAELGGSAEQQQDQIYSALELNPALFENELAELSTNKKQLSWQREQDRFVAVQKRCIGELTIAKKPLTDIDDEERTSALLELLREQGLSLLDWNNDCVQFCARNQLLLKHSDLLARFQLASQDWPSFDEQALLGTLEQWLAPALTNIKRLSDLKKIDTANYLKQRLVWPQLQALNELCPEKIAAASGLQHSIDYSKTTPAMACKLQEMFGCERGPSILNGRLELCLELLSPAQRPLQVTQDLAAFWKNGYEQVKKEMKGRYPKHPWPDNPLSAAASHLTKKRLNKQ
ncbi:ATP-dependent helicase HrpB [Agaribacterium haliotis]|uniref:ATP-dependent helicase HrpB n=1 Tax=Agaribacterium haliotis TaxID=2013869 RepID=UPI000BB55A92|nr:ATP-dependent helicase HrpB [Agaribacterium haliotis]